MAGFLALTLVFVVLYVFVPVWTTPGNELAYQLSVLRVRDWLLMVFLSVLSAVVLVMQWHILRQKKSRKQALASSAQGGATGAASLFAALVGTAACSSCLAGVLALLGFGFGTTLFILQYGTYFMLGAILLLLVSLYYSGRQIAQLGEACKVPKK